MRTLLDYFVNSENQEPFFSWLLLSESSDNNLAYTETMG